MKMVFTWFRRELQNDRVWVGFFVLCLALGLLGFSTLIGFRQSLDFSLRQNAKNLLSADLAFSARRILQEAEVEVVRKQISPSFESHVTEMFSMAAAESGSRLVQLKAIDENYPLYGSLKLSKDKVIGTRGSGELEVLVGDLPPVWVFPELLIQLNLKMGDTLKLGEQLFRISDEILQDSTQTFRMAGLAPRVYISRKFLPQTKLISFGATLSDVYLFDLDSNQESSLAALAQRIESGLKDPGLDVSTPFDQAQDSSRPLQYLLDYLGLVSLVALGLALVGLGYLTQLYLSRRQKTWSLLRVLGLSPGKAEKLIILQISLLGLLAWIVVTPISFALFPLVNRTLIQILPVAVELKVSFLSLGISLGLALLLPASLAFPLLFPFRSIEVRKILIENNFEVPSLRLRDLWAWIPLLALLYLLTRMLANSWQVANLFYLSFLSLASLTYLGTRWGLSCLPDLQEGFLLRQSFLKIRRNSKSFSLVVLSLSFGVLLLTLLPQLRETIRGDFESPDQKKLPSLFLFDIQDEQLPALKSWISERSVEATNLSPLIRARILTVNGEAFEREVNSREEAGQTREQQAAQRFRNRGVNLTIREGFSASESLQSGRLFSAAVNDRAQLSVEKRFAERLNLKLGDRIVFDVQSVLVEGEIVNFRTVKWNSFQPNFFIVVQPGFLEDAPKIWLMSWASVSSEKKVLLQNELVQKFPNVSVVDVERVVANILKLSEQMSWALGVMAILSVIVGFFILVVVLITESERRFLEWNMLKILGADQKTLRLLFLAENLLVCSLATLVGSVAGLGLAGALAHFVFDSSLRVSWLFVALAILMPILTALLLGQFLASRLTKTTPMALLASGRT